MDTNNNYNINQIENQIIEDKRNKQLVISELTQNINDFLSANNIQPDKPCLVNNDNIQTLIQLQNELNTLFGRLIKESDKLINTYEIKKTDDFGALMTIMMTKIKTFGIILENFKTGGNRRTRYKNIRRRKHKTRKNKI